MVTYTTCFGNTSKALSFSETTTCSSLTMSDWTGNLVKPVTNAWLELTTSGVKEIVSLPVPSTFGPPEWYRFLQVNVSYRSVLHLLIKLEITQLEDTGYLVLPNWRMFCRYTFCHVLPLETLSFYDFLWAFHDLMTYSKHTNHLGSSLWINQKRSHPMVQYPMMGPWDESGIPFTYVKNPLKDLQSHNNPITPKWATKTKTYTPENQHVP